jgi:ATP-dependent DNA helicase RecQ
VAIDESIWQQAVDLRSANAELLSDARATTRFLCGLSSPKLIRAKLTRHPLFGALEQVPFPIVLARATAEVKDLPF